MVIARPIKTSPRRKNREDLEKNIVILLTTTSGGNNGYLQ